MRIELSAPPTTLANASRRSSTVPARRRVARRPGRQLRGAARLPARAGGGALRRAFVGPCGSCDVCNRDARIGVDLEPTSSSAGGHRRSRRRSGGVAHVAARSQEPDRNVAWLAEGTTVSTPVRRISPARGGDRGRRPALGRAPRGVGRSRGDDDARRIPASCASTPRSDRRRSEPSARTTSTRASSCAFAAGGWSAHRKTPSRVCRPSRCDSSRACRGPATTLDEWRA